MDLQTRPTVRLARHPRSADTKTSPACGQAKPKRSVSVALARALCDLDASRKPAYTVFALVCFRDDNVKTVFSVHQMETF